MQARKAQRKNFSHTEARLREIKQENKMMVDRLAHVSTSQDQSPPPQAPVSTLTDAHSMSSAHPLANPIFLL